MSAALVLVSPAVSKDRSAALAERLASHVDLRKDEEPSVKRVQWFLTLRRGHHAGLQDADAVAEILLDKETGFPAGAVVGLEGGPLTPLEEVSPATLRAWLMATLDTGPARPTWPGEDRRAMANGGGERPVPRMEPRMDETREESFRPGGNDFGEERFGFREGTSDAVGSGSGGWGAPTTPTVRGGWEETAFELDGSAGDSPRAVRSGDTTAAAGTAEAPVTRYLNGEMPERVRLGEETELLITVSLLRGAGASTAALRDRVSLEDQDVRLVLQSPGFAPLEGTSRVVHVPAGQDSDPALFRLRAEKQGVCDVRVSAFLGGMFLGALQMQVTVDPVAATGPSVARRSGMPPRQRQPGEVTLFIRYDEEDQVYRYQFIDDTIGFYEPMESARLRRTPDKCVEDVVAQFNLMARNRLQYSASTTRRALKGHGIVLWQELFPADLQRLFWERHADIRRLIIQADGDPIPWEILYPTAPEGDEPQDRGFLVEQFPIARWQGRTPPVAELHRAAPVFVRPAGSPASADAEIQALRELLGVPATTPVDDLDELLDRLEAADFDLLHFACHNTFQPQNPTASHVAFGPSPFTPALLASMQRSLRKQVPLVFMNACRSDGQAANYTRLAGWANGFLSQGAGAFVGSLWEVRDTTAAEFAGHFYQALLDGENLGEALRQARQAIQSEPGDPTWLAYTLYGDPAATLVGP